MGRKSGSSSWDADSRPELAQVLPSLLIHCGNIRKSLHVSARFFYMSIWRFSLDFLLYGNMVAIRKISCGKSSEFEQGRLLSLRFKAPVAPRWLDVLSLGCLSVLRCTYNRAPAHGQYSRNVCGRSESRGGRLEVSSKASCSPI